MMQSAENLVMGHTSKGRPATVMMSAATRNEQASFVGHQGVEEGPAGQGVSVTETNFPDRRVLTESIAGQVVGEYEMPVSAEANGGGGGERGRNSAMTIGQALEATARTAGNEPVDRSDAAAIQAAEARATRTNMVASGGVAAAAQAAADANARITRDEDKIKLADVLSNATAKLPVDREVTRADAERVTVAEMRNDPEMATRPGVAASVVEAARRNQKRK
ncbi:Late embryogenesis abundant protein 31 [Cocos nucifera]|uniref:Late embryogenesis abundant protein 31 n=1 Tax=Cocos nucifera TaxID=13894 RepID=A0A8K0MY38_COCNU|nr:Late embryogenesis abundant protein 31 [Cocos nucifera]